LFDFDAESPERLSAAVMDRLRALRQKPQGLRRRPLWKLDTANLYKIPVSHFVDDIRNRLSVFDVHDAWPPVNMRWLGLARHNHDLQDANIIILEDN